MLRPRIELPPKAGAWSTAAEDAGRLAVRPARAHVRKWPGAHRAIRAAAQARSVRLPAGRPLIRRPRLSARCVCATGTSMHDPPIARELALGHWCVAAYWHQARGGLRPCCEQIAVGVTVPGGVLTGRPEIVGRRRPPPRLASSGEFQLRAR